LRGPGGRQETVSHFNVQTRYSPVRLQRGLAVAIALLLQVACSRQNSEDLLAQHRNLGKAFYENPTTKQEAVQEFEQALKLAPDSAREKLNYALALLRASGHDEEAVQRLQEVQRQDPSLPHTWFNLGIYYKRQGDANRAIAQFEGMLARAPSEAIGHYQLGALYRQVNRNAEAQMQFERAAELDPLLAAAPFQLYNLQRLAGNTAQANRYLADFQRIQTVQKGWVIPEDVEWCAYAEIYDPPAARVEAAAPPEPTFTDTRLDGTVDFATAGLTLIDSTGGGRTDLLVWSSQGIRVFRSGQQPAGNIGLEGLTHVIDVAPGDFDNDGLMDLCVLTAAGPALFRNTGGKFVRDPARLPVRRFEKAVWLDYDHDYDLDLVLLGTQPALVRNQGTAGWTDRTGDFPFVKGAVTSARKLRVDPDSKAFDLAVFYGDRTPVLYSDKLGGRYAVEAFRGNPLPDAARTQVDADFDGDGRLDRARIDPDGSVHLMRNSSSDSTRRWINVQLKGVRSLKLAQDALVEIKAGNLYRSQFYTGVPLLFDAGDHATIDAVRITWPNGLIQNEIKQATNQAHTYEEAQRLSGSCPMIWTWNGREFEFITDVLGVAPLGASDGDGSYFPVDHDEYVQIPGAALSQKGGHYDIRVTEELSEVSYLDQIQLYAVDHAAGTEIFTNEKFKGPPYPEFRLFGVEQRIYPQAARDDQGRDVLPSLLSRDQHYPDQFSRSETGVADLHTLELDFGAAAPSGKAILLLNGWVDWPDGSTFRRASQESAAGLTVPYLQVQDAQGRWRTINKDMGMPAGKPKTIAVPVEFLSASRKVRIVTNLCVYWDEMFLSEDVSNVGVVPKLIPLVSADLHFRGFSESRIDPQRKQPDTFFYGHVSSTSFWNPTPGLYTRFGRVDELLRDVDDRLVIMGSGDEVSVQFESKGLEAPRPGWTRDFLLKVDGWAKDRDPNTAFSSSVLPLPFHGMSRYPYPENEHYARDTAHDDYQRAYNTRPARALIQPLDSH
jgi:Tfp pilus assembly protein PilF